MRLRGTIVPARRLLAALLVTSAAIAAPSAQAQLIYPHSPAEEKAASELKEGLATAKKAHLDAIDKHKGFLAEAIARERQLITERELALRDAGIVTAVDANFRDKGAGAGPLALKQEIGARLTTLTGIDASRAAQALSYLNINAETAALTRARVESVRARLQRQISLFEAGGGEGKYCSEDGSGMADRPEKAGSNPQVFSSIARSCRRIANDLGLLNTIYSGTPDRPIRALLGDASAADALPLTSPVRAALDEANASQRLLTAQRAVGEAVQKRLKELKAYHRCELDKPKSPGQAERVSAAAQSVQDFIDWTSNWGMAEPAELEKAPEVKTAPGTTCAPGDLAEGGILTLAGQDRQKLDGWISKLDGMAPFRAIVAGAQEASQGFKSNEISEILSALADPARTGDQPDSAAAAASLLRLYAHAEMVGAYRKGKLPSVSGTVVQLAAAEMRQATAQIEIGRFEKVAALAASRYAGLIQEALALQRAYGEVTGPTPSFEHGVLAYSDAWTVGRIPATVLHYDMINTAYTSWADRERAVIEAAYAALEPIASELQVYGASGVKPDEIAGYLQALGLGAIAW